MAHILDNSCKFCPDGEVSVQLYEDGAEGHVVLSDRGPGLPVGRPMQVFETFWQVGDNLTDKPLGVGLGLAFCRELVIAQGGRIWAENREGGGAIFHITYPLVAA